MDDFVTVSFDETDGFRGFYHTWSTPEPSNISVKPIDKAAALAAAKPLVKQITQGWDGYLLGKLDSQELIIVTPGSDSVLKVNTEGNPVSNDVKNKPRLAWMVNFKLELDPLHKGPRPGRALGVGVFIDAETGACIGAFY